MKTPHLSTRRISTRGRSALHRLVLAVAAVSVLAACSEEDKTPGEVYVPPEQTNNDSGNGNNTRADSGENANTDTGPDATTEIFDGVMTGTWAVKRASDDESQATLVLRHKASDDTVTGTYQLASGGPEMPANIDSASWRNNAFNANWSARIEGSDETFQITNAIMQTETQIFGNYSDSRVAMAFDVSITRTDVD